MKKIALEKTIVEAYTFFFQNIISVIGTIWFPCLILAAVIAAFAVGIVPHEWLTGHFTPVTDIDAFLLSRVWLILTGITVIWLVAIVVSAMIRVGLLRLAFEDRPKLTLFWFSLDARVWRMVAALILTSVFVIFLFVVAALVVVAANVAFAAMKAPLAATILANIVLVIAAIIGLVYAGTRLSFFLPPIVVAKNKLGFSEAWALGKGNVLRIIVVVLAIVIPVGMVADIVLYAAMIPTVMVQAMQMPPAASNDPAAAEAMFKALLPLMPVFIGVGLLSGAVSSGLITGAMGKAYRAISSGD